MSVRFDIHPTIDAGKKANAIHNPIQWLLSRVGAKCPDCGGGLQFRYQMPEEFREVSPKYYECSCCHGRFMKVSNGPWLAATSHDCDRIFQTTH